MTDSEEPKIIVDDDWKSQVQAEKEQAQKELEETASAAESAQMPPASMPILISMLGSQALAALGQFPDPNTGEAKIEKPIAKHFIDLLGVLEEKTAGNLTEDESAMISNSLHQLRMIFVSAPDSVPTPEAATSEKKPTIELP